MLYNQKCQEKEEIDKEYDKLYSNYNDLTKHRNNLISIIMNDIKKTLDNVVNLLNTNNPQKNFIMISQEITSIYKTMYNIVDDRYFNIRLTF